MKPRTAYAMLQLTVLIWGFTAVIGKQITIGATSLVFYRQLITVAVMAIWVLARGKSLRVTGAQALQLAGVGAIISLHWVCFYGCIKTAGVAVAVLCLASVVLVTAIVEPLVFRRALRGVEVAIGVLVLIGVWLLVRIETSASMRAIAAGLIAAIAGATFGTLNGRIRRDIASDVMTVWELGSGAVWLGLASLALPEGLLAPSAIGAHDWLWLAILAVVCTALPWLWSLDVLTVLTPYTVALSVTLEPVYSMVIAFFWFPESERLAPSFYAGAAVLIGLVMIDGQIRTRSRVTA